MAEQDQAEQNGKRTGAAPRNRSPSHPAFDLGKAVERARELYRRERLGFTPTHVAMQHWGYSSKGSSGIRALAALIHFGLLDEEGSSGQRRVRLSQLAKRIILDEREVSTEREAAVREAALRPTIYKDLWEKSDGHLPSDDTLTHTLVWDYGFNRESVRDFIKDFRATVEFARLEESDKLSTDDVDKRRPDEGSGVDTGDSRRTPPPPPPPGRPMPETQRQNAQPWDLTIPLIGGGQAILRTPIPLSEADYMLLTTTLDVMLKNMKPAITVAAAAPNPPASPPASTGAEEM